MELAQLLKEYKNEFGECFPTMNFMGDDDEMVKEISKCLEYKKPYAESQKFNEAVF